MSESHLEACIIQPAKHQGFIARLWHGELPLWKTYWLYGCVGNLVLRLASPALTYLLTVNATSLSDFDSAALRYSFLAFYFAYNFVVLGGIWRSADNYRALNPGSKIYGTLAKVVVFFSVFGLLGTLTKLAAPDSASSNRPESHSTSPDEQLQVQATLAGLNHDLPKMVDKVTRLDKIDYKNNTLIYYMAITVDITDKEVLVANLKTKIKTNVCANMTAALKEGSTIEYVYADKAAQSITEVVITKADCPNP